MSMETANTNDTDPPGLLPGAELKAQREAGGHSLEAVATDTRITHSKLMALEADDYARVGSEIFVVGYIRKYAKWLGIDANRLVEAFEGIVAPEARADSGEDQPQDADVKPKRFQARQSESNSRVLKQGVPLLWLIAAFLAVWVLAAVVLNGDESDNGAFQGTQSSGAVREQEQEQEQTLNASDQEDFVADAEPPQSSTAEPLPDMAADGDDGGAEAAVDEISDAVPSVDAETPTQIAPAAPVAVQPRPEPESSAAALIGTDTLTMSFSGACWVEINDANGDSLFAQLQQEGDNLRLSGQAPFEVMLGNARVVTLLVNGRVVNTNPGPSRDTLRLSAGP